MKKIGAVVLSLFAVCLLSAGCGKSTENFVKENMSETVEVYFFGETPEVYGTISSGKRELDYNIDGKSGELTDYSLFSINFYNEVFGSVIKVNLTIDGVTSEVEMELNTLNNTYMVDLGKRMSGDEVVSVEYMEEEFELKNVSKDFVVDADEAIEIASNELSEVILRAKKHSNLNAECYLRVMDKRMNNFQDMFWCFTVVNVDGESFSIIISTVDGSVLAKSV